MVILYGEVRRELIVAFIEIVIRNVRLDRIPFSPQLTNGFEKRAPSPSPVVIVVQRDSILPNLMRAVLHHVEEHLAKSTGAMDNYTHTTSKGYCHYVLTSIHGFCAASSKTLVSTAILFTDKCNSLGIVVSILETAMSTHVQGFQHRFGVWGGIVNGHVIGSYIRPPKLTDPMYSICVAERPSRHVISARWRTSSLFTLRSATSGLTIRTNIKKNVFLLAPQNRHASYWDISCRFTKFGKIRVTVFLASHGTQNV